MTREETARIMAYLRELYPNGKKITEQTVIVWHDVLKDYEFEVIKEAAREAAKTYEGYTMPPPAVIIRHIRKEPKLKLYAYDIPELTEEERLLADRAREETMAHLRLVGGEK